MKKFLTGSGIIIFLFPLLLIFLALGGQNNYDNVSDNIALNEEQLAFVYSILPGAMQGQEEGLFPSITIAQAIHESGWGKSGLAANYNNLFGVKADSSWTGKVVELPTQEEVQGGMITIMAKWRVYDSWNHSVEDRIKFLLENSNYRNNGVFDAKNYVEQAEALQRAGYATDTSYAAKLIETIQTYSLYVYDLMPGTGNEIIEKAIAQGMSIVGRSPYVFGGGRNPEDIEALRFDCSSFVHWCYANAGIELGDYRSVTTYSLVNMGQVVSFDEVQRGDLIFFDTYTVDGHIGIWLGDNKFLHDGTSTGVTVSELTGYYKDTFNGKVRRIIVEQGKDGE